MLPFEHYVDACLERVLGERGLSTYLYQAMRDRAAPALQQVRQDLASGRLAHFALASRRDDLKELATLARQMRDQFQQVIVLGTGGATAGASALVRLASQAERQRVIFADNLDGHDFSELLATADPRRTAFLAISRSGDTLSTLAQSMAALQWLTRHRGTGRLDGHFAALTLPGDNPLRRLAQAHRGLLLDYAATVPGRFGTLSGAGLLPAMLAGLDAQAVRTGASMVFESAISEPESAPLNGAAALVGLAQERRRSHHVMLVYGGALEEFAGWHRVLTAECLARNAQGITPMRALGPRDQHGQMQLWLDGPPDKQFTVITVADSGSGAALPALPGGDPELDALAGHSLNNVVQTQARATIETLAGHGVPTRLIRLNRLDEKSLGGLVMHFMLETVLAAHLLGVDPYGAPVADAGKSLTQTYLKHAKLRRP